MCYSWYRMKVFHTHGTQKMLKMLSDVIRMVLSHFPSKARSGKSRQGRVLQAPFDSIGWGVRCAITKIYVPTAKEEDRDDLFKILRSYERA